MRALSHSLAESLARRLNEAMPAGFRLTPANARLALHVNGFLDGTVTSPELADEETRELEERLWTAVYGVLNYVQDSISEETREPWPSKDRRAMAMPGVRVGRDAIYLWYGDETAPVLGLPKIPLAEIMEQS